MKKFNYFYYGTPITKAEFLASGVPDDWQENLNEYGEYSWGGYRAVEIDQE